MKYLLVIFLYTALSGLSFAGDSFITEGEYGEMLYNNPRGIGCIHCHGKKGEGALIAKYRQSGKSVYLKGPDIRNVSLSDLKKSLLKRHRIMPTYFLTDKEIRAIFHYLHQKER